MLRHTCAALLALLVLPLVAHASPLLLLHPTLSKDQIAFRHADDIWVVARTGGDAIRLTSTASVVAGPYFSPDGQTLAYSAHPRQPRRIHRVRQRWRPAPPHVPPGR